MVSNGTLNSFNNTGSGRQNFSGAKINSGANSMSISDDTSANFCFSSPARSRGIPIGSEGTDESAVSKNSPTEVQPPREDYYNSGEQHIKGLTNQTGYIVGNANGAINFGTLTVSAATQRQPE